MAENKTKATKASVKSYLAAIKDESRRKDCVGLTTLMTKATKHPPIMWGTSIVGFGCYHYKYESGREGDMCLIGFSPRSQAMTLYLGDLARYAPMLGRLGKHTNGQGCLHVRKLEDVDRDVLKQLVSEAYKNNKAKHKQSGNRVIE